MEIDEISEDQAPNDVIYKKMKKQLTEEFPGRTIVIALVTRIEKKPMHAKIRGNSLRMLTSERA